MFGIEFIEVAIGLVFAFFAISTICSGVVEIWTRATKLRSRHLRDALQTMLDDPKMDNLVKKLYDHPGLFAPVKKKLGAINHIDPKDFAETFLDILGGAGDAAFQRALLDRAQKIPNETLKNEIIGILNATPAKVTELYATIPTLFSDATNNFDFATYLASFKTGSVGFDGLKARISNIKTDAIRTQLDGLISLTPAQLTAQKTDILAWFDETRFAEACFELIAISNAEYERFRRLEAEIKTVQDPYLQQKMLRILYSCADGLEKLESRVENWFNETMTDVSKWYKKRVQWVLTGISIIVVTGLNADAVRLASDLWNDNEVRTATVQLASGYIERQDSVMRMDQQQQMSKMRRTAPTSVDSNGNTIAPPPAAADKDSLNMASFDKLVRDLRSDIEVAEQMPIGWNSEPLPWSDNFPDNQSPFWWYLSKVLGLAITVGATSFGATFWYDLLRNLLNLRTGLTGGRRKQQEPAPQS